MSRIDANIATQVGDASRPYQSVRDAALQTQEAARQETARPDPDTPVNPDEVKAAAQQLQQVVKAATGRELDFALNDRFKELVVKISDRKSGEVVKEIPSKDMLKLRERLNDLIGMFINEKA